MPIPWEPDESPLRQIQTITLLHKLWYRYQQLMAEVVQDNPPPDLVGEPYLLLYVSGAGGVCYENRRQEIVFVVQWDSLVAGVLAMRKRIREHTASKYQNELEKVTAKARAVAELERTPDVAQVDASAVGARSDS